MSTNKEETILFEIERKTNLRIRGKIKYFKGSKYFDLRTYYLNEEKDVFLPTPKGICLPLEMLEELKKGIDEAYRLYVNSLAKESPEAVKEK